MNALASSALGRAFFATAIFCMAIAIVVLGKQLLAPIALSFILAFVLTPIVRRLESLGIGRIPSVLTIVVLLSIFSVFLGAKLLSQLNTLVDELPQHRQEIEEKLASFRTGPSSPIGHVLDLAKDVLGNVGELGSDPQANDIQRVAIVEENSPMPWVASISNLLADVLEPLALSLVVVVLVLVATLVGSRIFSLNGRSLATSSKSQRKRGDACITPSLVLFP